jgi:hypothetical protein
MRAGIAVLLAGVGAPPDQTTLNQTFLSGGSSLLSDGQSVRVSDNVVRHIDGRALHIVATGPVQVDGNFLSSEGFHGSFDSEDSRLIGDVVFIQNLGGPWERFNIDDLATMSDFLDYDNPRDALNYLFNLVPTSPRHFVGLGGQVLFQNNQVVYDWQVILPPSRFDPLTIFAVAVMSLDHTSISANQFSLRLVAPANIPVPPGDSDMGSDEPFYAHVFATGATLEATSNRISEHADAARLSFLGLGELTFTAVHNQATHQIHATGANPVETYGILADNQQMLLKRGAFLVNNDWVFVQGARLFMKFLDRPTFLLGPPPTTPPGG